MVSSRRRTPGCEGSPGGKVGRAAVWAGETEAARNEIFNVTNGDTLRWKYMWPRIAKIFDIETAEPVPFPLTTYMADKAPVWDGIVRKHGLQTIPYKELVSWGYGDFAFRQDFDNVSSTIKVRQAGVHDCNCSHIGKRNS